MDPLSLLLFMAGLVLLIGGAELLVRGASRLAAHFGISPLVIGLTVVAYGTSAPELAINISSAFSGNAALALGNVVGSNIFNILLILGVSALVTPLVVADQLVRKDVPIMIVASLVMLVMGLDGVIGWVDGLVLTAGLVAYGLWSVQEGRKDARKARQPRSPAGRKRVLLHGAFVLGGLGLLALGSRWLVEGSIVLASALGVSELIIGLTIVAAGTSLPEVATSVLASIRGERDIAVGNAVGSNIFNILSVLGMTGLIAPGGIPVPHAALSFDIPVMIAVAIACLPVFFHESRISRWEGALFLGYYVAYTAYLILDAVGHDYLPHFSTVMMQFVVPLTLLTLLIVVARFLRRSGQQEPTRND